MDSAVGALAVVVGLIGYAFYAYGIWRGEVRPHAFSWFVWTLLTGIAFAIQVAEGAGPTAWVTGASTLLSLVFTIAGLSQSARLYIARVDWFYFVGAVAAIPLWLLTDNPLYSVLLITLIDAIAFAPTFRKAYYNPETESLWQTGCAAFKYVIALSVLDLWTISTALYPASLVIMNGAFLIMLIARRKTSPSNI